MATQRYPLLPRTEMLIAYAHASRPRWHELIGHAIDHERMSNPTASLIVWACKEVAREHDTPPASTAVVLQRLRMQVNAGKLTMEAVGLADDLLTAVEDAGGVDDLEGLIKAVAPAIRQIAHMEAVEATIQEVSQPHVPGKTTTRFAAIDGLGTQRISKGVGLPGTAADILKAAISTITDPCPSGITELDIALGGGIERRSLCAFLANSGDGKSLALCHLTVQALLDGRPTCYVTLEISEEQVKQRIYCNLLGMTAEEMEQDPIAAAARYQALCAHITNPIGLLRVLYLPPKVSTVASITSWLDDLARDGDLVCEVLVVDYADKLADKIKAGVAAEKSYVSQGSVYEQLRTVIVERDLYGWTASQSTGRQGRKKKLDLEDMADSMEKARIADTVIPIIRTEDDVNLDQVRFRLAKRRNGKAHLEVGPLPMDPARGRMVVTSRSEPW